MTIEEILAVEIRQAKQKIDFGYKNRRAEDVVDGSSGLNTLMTFLSKSHENKSLLSLLV